MIQVVFIDFIVILCIFQEKKNLDEVVNDKYIRSIQLNTTCDWFHLDLPQHKHHNYEKLSISGFFLSLLPVSSVYLLLINLLSSRYRFYLFSFTPSSAHWHLISVIRSHKQCVYASSHWTLTYLYF